MSNLLNKEVVARTRRSYKWIVVLVAVSGSYLLGLYGGIMMQTQHQENLMREAAKHPSGSFDLKGDVVDGKWIARASHEDGKNVITFDPYAIEHYWHRAGENPERYYGSPETPFESARKARQRLQKQRWSDCRHDAQMWQEMALDCIDEGLGDHDPPLMSLVEPASCDELEYYRDLAKNTCDLRVVKTPTTVITF